MGALVSLIFSKSPTQSEVLEEEFDRFLFSLLFTMMVIVFVVLVAIFESFLQEQIEALRFKNKIMKSNKDLKFHWKDIHIDDEIKKMLLDNVTRPLAIRQSSPNAALSADAVLPKGLLFSGPSGTGKTLLAMIVAKESKCNFLSIDVSDIKDPYYGVSEKKVKRIFKAAKENQPCILFIDEIDTILSVRQASMGCGGAVDNSIKGLFLSSWDGIETKTKGVASSSVIIIGATNRSKSLDPAFLRRLDLNIEIPLPNSRQRRKILEIILKDCMLEDGFKVKKIAEQATGFTGSDLAEAVRYAIMSCNAEYHKQLETDIANKSGPGINSFDEQEKANSPYPFPPVPFFKESFTKLEQEHAKPPKIAITMNSMEKSIAHSKNSRSSGGGVGGLDSTEMLIINNLIPPHDIETTWDDIAGCQDIIHNIKKNLILPMKVQMNKKFKMSKFLQCPKGILFHGPPGSGKTLLAKAIARHSGCSFINLQPSMLESKWYGETSQRTAALFSVAEKYQPCIIFMDEIDAFLRERRESDSEGSAGKKAQFLSLLDGILTDPKKVIILMGATNRLEDLDPALLRRLTLKFHIGTPDRTKRRDILQLLLKDEKLSDDVCLERLVDTTEEMTGADLKDILRTAIIEALYEKHSDIIEQEDINQQLTKTNDRKEYCKIIHAVSSAISQTNYDDNNYNNNIETRKGTSSNIISAKAPLENTEDEMPIPNINPSDVNVELVSSSSTDLKDSEEASIIVEIKMTHFVTAIEIFKKSKANQTDDAPHTMYC